MGKIRRKLAKIRLFSKKSKKIPKNQKNQKKLFNHTIIAFIKLFFFFNFFFPNFFFLIFFAKISKNGVKNGKNYENVKA